MAREIKRVTTKCVKCDATIHPQVYSRNAGLCLWCHREKRKAAEQNKE